MQLIGTFLKYFGESQCSGRKGVKLVGTKSQLLLKICFQGSPNVFTQCVICIILFKFFIGPLMEVDKGQKRTIEGLIGKKKEKKCGTAAAPTVQQNLNKKDKDKLTQAYLCYCIISQLICVIVSLAGPDIWPRLNHKQ